MTRYRAGYDLDYGRRAFDDRTGRLDVGSRGYDRGYLRTFGGGEYRRPWAGGYHEGYQGGSEGIAMNTAPSGSAYVRGEGAPWRTGYDRDYRSGREYGGYGRGRGEGGDRGPGLHTGGYDRDVRGRGASPRGNLYVDRGDQGYMGGGGEYDPRYLRGGGGESSGGRGGYDRGYHGYNRGYDGGWFNRWGR